MFPKHLSWHIFTELRVRKFAGVDVEAQMATGVLSVSREIIYLEIGLPPMGFSKR